MKTVAVDLDATLATYEGWRGIQHIGDPRPGAANFLRRCFTCGLPSWRGPARRHRT
jgi:hypothetical protein